MITNQLSMPFKPLDTTFIADYRKISVVNIDLSDCYMTTYSCVQHKHIQLRSKYEDLCPCFNSFFIN